MTTCPYCHGQKQVTTILDPGCRLVTRDCQDCSGTGQVEAAVARRVERGRQLAQIRKGRMVTLADVANEIGSTPVEINKMERGRIEPSAGYLAWCGVDKEDTSMNATTLETDG